MKLITLLLLLFTTSVVSQVKELSFDKVYLKAKSEQVTNDITINSTVRIYDTAITIKDSNGLFIFTIKETIKETDEVVILLVDSVKQDNVKVVYDKNYSAISFSFTDRFIMFYDSIKILKFDLKL